MEKTKLKLLYVLDILKETDETHPITSKQIVEKLKLYGIKAERKSVLRDIETLTEYGYDILLHADTKKGYFIASRTFEDWEVKILADAVAGAKFLTDNETQSLIERILDLSSKDGQSTLRKIVPRLSALKNEHSLSKTYIDKIITALRDERKITFQYTYTDVNMQKKLRKSGCIYTVNPYSLVWRNDNYYLIGNTEPYKDLSFYRIDRLRNLGISGERAKVIKELLGNSAERKLSEFVNKTVYTYSGQKISLVLLVDECILDDLADYFGLDIFFRKCENGYEATIQTIESDGLFYWLLQYGQYVEILQPSSVREEYLRRIDEIRNKY